MKPKIVGGPAARTSRGEIIRFAIAALAVSLPFSGCEWLDDPLAVRRAAGDATASLERMTGAITKVIDTQSGRWRTESEAWRAAMFDLEEALKKDAEDLLANDVRHCADHIVANANTVALGNIEYVEAKLRATLRATRDAMVKAKEDIKSAKNKGQIKEILAGIWETQAWPDPEIIKPIPDRIKATWDDSSKRSFTLDAENIELYGWGFKRPAHETNAFGLYRVTREGRR